MIKNNVPKSRQQGCILKEKAMCKICTLQTQTIKVGAGLSQLAQQNL